MSTQVATQTKQLTINQFLNKSSISDYLHKQLGEKKGEFVSNLIALSNSDTNLAKCNPQELMMCAMNATALNLPLNKNLGYAYVIPYGNKPQFQIGYKGFIQLAIRSGQYKTINTCEVREGEISRNKFTGHIDFLKENPSGKIIGYLAYIEMLNGFQQSLYMTVAEAKEHGKKYSKMFNSPSGLWSKEFDLMAKKTVLKLLLNRYGVLSTEMQKAIISDQSDAEGNYIDNPQRKVIDTDYIEQDEPAEEVPAQEVNLSDI